MRQPALIIALEIDTAQAQIIKRRSRQCSQSITNRMIVVERTISHRAPAMRYKPAGIISTIGDKR